MRQVSLLTNKGVTTTPSREVQGSFATSLALTIQLAVPSISTRNYQLDYLNPNSSTITMNTDVSGEWKMFTNL
jgi:hypothetical protein